MARKAGSKRRVASRQPARSNRDSISRGQLGLELQRQITRLGLSRRVAAMVLSDAETRISRLMKGHFREFSVERLVGMLLRLGSEVTITIRHQPRLGKKSRATIRVIRKA